MVTITMDPACDSVLLTALRCVNSRYGIPPSRFETWIRCLHEHVGPVGVGAIFALLSVGVIWISSVLHLDDRRHTLQTHQPTVRATVRHPPLVDCND